MPVSGISSEVSAHQMAQSASSDAVTVPPSIPDSSVLCWTLVDQAVIPPGFEDAFLGFSEAWTEAAARDDHRKSLWGTGSAAVTLVAQKKAQEEKVRLERNSKDHFLLAAIQKRTAFRTRLQKILYEGATARKDAEEDERSRWLHIPAGIVQNTETPVARLLKENPGNTRLLGAGKRATTLRARVTSLRRYILWLSAAYKVSFPSEVPHLVDNLQARSQEPATRCVLK